MLKIFNWPTRTERRSKNKGVQGEEAILSSMREGERLGGGETDGEVSNLVCSVHVYQTQ